MDSVQRVEQKRHTSQNRQSTQGDTLTDWVRARVAFIMTPAARALSRLGVHPNTLTILGMVLQVAVGVVFGLGHTALGGCLLLIVGPVDNLDGTLARLVGRQSTFGAFLDSTLDRVSDAALILGLTTHYIRQGSYTEVALLLVSLVATMMISYVRAKAESLGLPCKVGVLTRFERILLIGALSALGLPSLMIWLLTLLSVFTVIQRVLCVYRASRQEQA
jgi:CDP-diacylglycerol--glycerol-3-phosphate 3-phosphatidyltransferase